MTIQTHELIIYEITTETPASVVKDILVARYGESLKELTFVKTDIDSIRIVKGEEKHIRSITFQLKYKINTFSDELIYAVDNFNSILLNISSSPVIFFTPVSKRGIKERLDDLIKYTHKEKNLSKEDQVNLVFKTL